MNLFRRLQLLRVMRLWALEAWFLVKANASQLLPIATSRLSSAPQADSTAVVQIKLTLGAHYYCHHLSLCTV